MNYILIHLKDPLSLDLLAKNAAMSRSYYSSLFKALNGIPVWDYITHQRINLAVYHLEHTTSPITQICEACGYYNISNFNRMFKRIIGKTPREYRKALNTK
ncbi:MAG: AraC family transcriptional regulator [Clostridiales bacterium]|nr:AraC family transcriptional regulator [Clostridiales bacterium]